MLWRKLANESASRCCTSATRDVNTVTCRSLHEGLSFLTITLPAFGKAFERALEQEQVGPATFLGFGYVGGLPRFLGGFLDLVFDRGSGRLLDEPNIDAILAIRQLTLMCGKISIPCSDARVRRAMRGFIECEQEVKVADTERNVIDLTKFREASAVLFRQVFSEADRKIRAGDILPKHGPGVTADRLLGNQKYSQRVWTTRLDRIMPWEWYILPHPSHSDEWGPVDLLEPENEIPVKVVSVPKTLKTPRIIAIEPTAMQYAQQAVREVLQDSIGRDHNLRRIIGFDDQVPNQLLAKKGSRFGTLATLDLSEASDRVSNQLVEVMFEEYPFLHAAIQASRSLRADVPGEGIVSLSKFASMGSALCFPVEALVFTTLIFMGIQEEHNRPLCSKDKQIFRDRVRVYGDDIIVPVEYVLPVTRFLEAFGAKLNRDKSFWNGKFRESCGKEYYAGEDVSIVRVRQLFPESRADHTEIISTISLRNQLYFAGYWETVKWLDRQIEDVIRHFPTVLPTSPVQGRHSFLGYETQKIGSDLHDPLVKGYVVRNRIPMNPLDGSGALLKYYLKRGVEPSFNEKHLERSGRPQAVNIKLGWHSSV
ncbi:TPA_asm: RNA-directed RNA polymerase [ssRNA phage Gerhypos.4_22]|uniref:RNA-directed RNA polymerase n=2 Tax=Leviviricetes TaxID=2842243 RepID=A0A8S5L281_9VIRU|nr:RNA-directed RNA polymerase [ssRNA phage Gerhypos.4_22]DAD51519.1 TPA_asm: RNA-directed RNA polymerase [ssRNA phage Gerhypos.4_22]